MPKIEIDYSNTIIYKITCKNEAITDVYVGHTTNFVQRKYAHKQGCINNKCKLYEIIRANGGWTNWQMEIIDFFNCADHYAAKKKEQEYFIALNATLNSVEPFSKTKVEPEPEPKPKQENLIISKNKKVFFCDLCNIRCVSSITLAVHNETNKHKNLLKLHNSELGAKKSPIKKSPKNSNKFTCTDCHYECGKDSDYKKHLATAKHKRLTIVNEPLIKTKLCFVCTICNKEYKSNVGLWKHKKKCLPIEQDPVINLNPASNAEVSFLTNIILEIVKNNSELQKQTNEIHKQNAELQKQNQDFHKQNQDFHKQNQDFQKQMMEFYKNGKNTVIANNNSHNKTFNLQFFLNETCKDAMNIKDFVNSMTLELEDLEEVGKLGYVEGISNIIIRKLNALDVHKRPIHCSDAKREIMFVKDDNIWEKENCTYDKLRRAIKSVTYKNSALLGPWSEKYPNCLNNQHHLNDVYVQMLGQAMGGKESFLESENKIMKKIAKSVLIEK
jgi:hypothetical protein